MNQQQKQQLTLISLMLLIAGLDQWSKNAIQGSLNTGQSIPLLPDVFHLTLTYNTGAAFSMFQNQPILLTASSLIIFLALLFYCFFFRTLTQREQLFFGFILGGAVGNLYDRLTIGQVVDFLDVTVINYPVFNLADSFICIGVMGLIWHLIQEEQVSQHAPQNQQLHNRGDSHHE